MTDAATPAGARLIELPRFSDARGTLAVIEEAGLPFAVRRFYCLYDVPRGQRRGGHAHRTEQELILALAGRLRLVVDDGRARREFALERPDLGLYVPALHWHELFDFSPGCVCAVLASQPYDKDDYFDRYEDFLAHLRARA